MKQVIQSYKTGEISLSDVPMPACKSGGLLVKNSNSLISIGTEKMMIDIAKKNLLGKALARPDLVKRLIDKAKKEGILNVIQEAKNRLDEPVALGYSSSGVVLEVGSGISEFKIGDRVACVGAGFASHAEVVWVPEKLCIKLPDNVSHEEAAFVMLGGIAMEGIRLADLTFGENVTVIGLGLLGLITVQILNAYGCEVIGIDIDENKINMAKDLGLHLGLVSGKDDVLASIGNYTKGFGTDAVIITAASNDNSTIDIAEKIARKKGKIILVGVSDINLSRKAFWEKELSFTVSKAAGPGSIEPIYEQAGYDYPIEYVRWTEKRNLEQFITLLANKRVNTAKLITHRFNIEKALNAYEMILGGKERCIGALLEYDHNVKERLVSKIAMGKETKSILSGKKVSIIGGGMFTRNILLPAVKKVDGIDLIGIATTTGISSNHIAKKYGFKYCTSDYKEILNDKETESVIITTRHNLHAKMAKEALQAGKHVFLEKPLAIKEKELNELKEVYDSSRSKGLRLMIGFNRRYSNLAKESLAAFGKRITPLVMVYRINAGYIPADHWTQDKEVGGGRIIGEVCHFIDFLQFISNSLPISVFTSTISGEKGKYLAEDNVVLNIGFADGSIGTIIYSANGSKAFSRERVEIFGDDTVLTIDDFKTATVIKNGKAKTIKHMSQDMGYLDELKYFINSSDFAADKLFEGYLYTTLTAFKAIESIEKNVQIKIELS